MRHLMVSNTIVSGPRVRGGRKDVLHEQVTVEDWCRRFATEQATSGESREIAKQAPNYMVLGEQETWVATAHILSGKIIHLFVAESTKWALLHTIPYTNRKLRISQGANSKLFGASGRDKKYKNVKSRRNHSTTLPLPKA